MVNTNLLKAKIVANGYSQTSLAQKMSMSKNTLCAKINGKAKFDLDEALALCNVLQITEPAEKCEIFLPS